MENIVNRPNLKSCALLVGGIVLILLWKFGPQIKPVEIDDLAVAMGYFCIPAALVWAVIYFAFERRVGPKWGALYFLIIYSSVIGINFVIGYYYHQQAALLVGNIENDFEKYKSGNAKDIVSSDDAHNPLKSFRGIFDNAMKLGTSDQEKFVLDMKNSHVNDLISPYYVHYYANAHRRALIVSTAHKIIEERRILLKRRIDDERTEIANSDTPENLKSQMLSGFDESVPHAHELMNKMLDVEQHIVDEIDIIATIIYRNPRPWHLQGGKLIFSDSNYEEHYNNDLTLLGSAYGEELQLASELQAGGRQKIDKLKDIAK